MITTGQGGDGGANDPGISTGLLDRQRILQFLEEIRKLPDSSRANIGGLVGEMVTLGPMVAPSLLHLLGSETNSFMVELALATLEFMMDHGMTEQSVAIAALKRLALQEGISDECRMQIVIFLGRRGVSNLDRPFVSALQNFATLVEYSRERVLSEIAADEFLLGQFLETLLQQPADAQIYMLEDYARSDQPVVFHLYRILGRSNDLSLGRVVVKCLEEKHNRDAAQALLGIASDSLCLETRRQADRALRKLQFGGVTPVLNSSATKLRPIYSTLISTVDGVGNRMVWIARRGKNASTLSVIHLLINEVTGIQDCFGGMNVQKRTYEKHVRTLMTSNSSICDTFDYDYCIDLIQDALAINQEKANPIAPQFFMLMDLFSGRGLNLTRYVPEFPGIDLNLLKWDQDLVETSTVVLLAREFSAWFVTSDLILSIAQRANRLTNPFGKGMSFRRSVADQMDKMVRQILHSEIVPRAPLLRRRMLLTADFLLRSSSLGNKDNAMRILAVMQHLPENSPSSGVAQWPADAFPADENPFLLALARISLEHAQLVVREIKP